MPIGWAVAFGASNYVTQKIRETRAAEQTQNEADEEEARLRRKADDSAAQATLQFMEAGRDKEFIAIPDYSTGGVKITALNQYSTKKDDDVMLSPDPSLAWYNALSTDKQKYTGKTHRFVAVNPNLTPQDVKRGKFADGTPVVAGKDYVLFNYDAATAKERGDFGLPDWINTIRESQEAVRWAIRQAQDPQSPNNTALSKIMGFGATLTSQWQKSQEPTEMLEGQVVYQASPFSNTGPLRFLKDAEFDFMRNTEAFSFFSQNAAEQGRWEFINSLNELGYNIPDNQPVSYKDDGSIRTAVLTGDWDRYQDRDGNWNQEFIDTIGRWSAGSKWEPYEWMRTLNRAAERSDTLETSRDAFNSILRFEEEMAKLGQPIDFTQGAPEYRNQWARAIQGKFRALLAELNLEGPDTVALVAAVMPQDLYEGMKMKLLSGGKSVLQAVRPGENIQDLRNEYSSNVSAIKDAKVIRDTAPAGTGFTADLKLLRDGGKDQIRQIINFFGNNPAGIEGATLGVLQSFFKPEELDPDQLDTLTRDALALRVRKFAVIRLMYNFAKGMGSASDRLSDQDAAFALQALQFSGLLNSEAGMKTVMNVLINRMEKRNQVLAGWTSGNERKIVAGAFLHDLHEGSQGDFMSSIMEAWTTRYNDNPSSVKNPATFNVGNAPKKKRN